MNKLSRKHLSFPSTLWHPKIKHLYHIIFINLLLFRRLILKINLMDVDDVGKCIKQKQ